MFAGLIHRFPSPRQYCIDYYSRSDIESEENDMSVGALTYKQEFFHDQR